MFLKHSGFKTTICIEFQYQCDFLLAKYGNCDNILFYVVTYTQVKEVL